MSRRYLFTVSLFVASVVQVASSQCQFRWVAVPGAEAIDGAVYASAVWDPDGDGPIEPYLAVVGDFTTIDGQSFPHIAAFRDYQWTGFAQGLGSTAYALATYHGQLYCGGQFGVRRWNGSNWETPGFGVAGTVHALAIFDDELVAGGSFSSAGGQPVLNVAKWNDTLWSQLGLGLNSTVRALEPNPNGAELVAGGLFTRSGATEVNRVARWDRVSWSALGGGSGGGFNSAVLSLKHTRDQVGNLGIVAGGNFTQTSAGVAVENIAGRFTSTWQPLVGGGLRYGGQVANAAVLTLTEFGTQPPLLIAGGHFTSAGGNVARGVAQWSGSVWNPVGANGGILGIEGTQDTSAFTICSFLGDLFLGGNFVTVDGVLSPSLARWTGKPFILQHPVDMSACAGSASVSVVVSGPGPSSFDWQILRVDGLWESLQTVPVAFECSGGGTGVAYISQLNSPSVEVTVTGCFEPQIIRCRVTNSCGMETSRLASFSFCGCYGDVDCNCTVSLEDLSVLLSNFGVLSGASREDGDTDGDGDIDLVDLSIMLSQFGLACS